MPTNTAMQTWRSGDWKKKPAQQKPYNGIEISVTPTYDPETQTLVTVSILFKDYTNDAKGIESILPLVPAPSPMLPIPIPPTLTSPPSSPPAKNTSFTIDGTIALETNGSNFSPRIRLNYGLEHAKRDEIGYIMLIPMIQAPA